jgi:hypothetical protein
MLPLELFVRASLTSIRAVDLLGTSLVDLTFVATFKASDLTSGFSPVGQVEAA